ncbi:MAG TPA: hypothetical protein VLX91_11400 [Candidatus Acidoferrales bacterium]|nr:hypothetical protein [Candidatus Acidoferrales bacterium]
MGTQQILLLVLGTFIVGVAVVLAIIYFRSNQQQTEIDEVINELNHISSTAQGWYRKPTQLGGGDGSFTGFTLMTVAQPDTTGLAIYHVVSAKGDSLSLEAVGFSHFTINVVVSPSSIGAYTVIK